MFGTNPEARADLKAGTLYAVVGEHGWIYYGQVTPERAIGFVRRRDRKVGDVDALLLAPVMVVVFVAHPSIGRALRSGRWLRLERFPLIGELAKSQLRVQWPVRTRAVTVWSGKVKRDNTRVDDPAIQDMERIAAWDAEHHMPARLTADLGAEKAAWHVGGPIHRERKIAEERARRFPDNPLHQLPPDWVPTVVH